MASAPEPGRQATRRTTARGIAGEAHGGQAQRRGHVGGERRQGLRRRQLTEAAEPDADDLVLDRVHIEGGLLVGVRRDVGVHHAAAQPPREHGLEAHLVRGLVAAGLAEPWLGALGAEERALAGDRPGAVLVAADHAGAGGEQRRAHEADVVHGHEADELEPVGRGRRQRYRGLQPQQLRALVGDAAARLVEIGVRGDHRDAAARRGKGRARRRTRVGDAGQRLEDERVMREHEPAARSLGLGQRRVVSLERDEHSADVVVARADLQTDVVPRLGELERREPVDDTDDVADQHVGDSSTVYTAPMVVTAPSRRPWLVLLAVAPGIFLTLADATVMSVAIPQIVRHLQSSVIAVSWVMNGYNLVLAVLFLTFGRLSDRYGHKRLFVAGLALFTLASLGCALSRGIQPLVLFRVVQAIGAAAVIPTSLALLIEAFPAERRGLAAGLFGALSSAAAAAGPAIGGVLVQKWNWPAIFWFNLPVGALGVVLALALVPGRRGDKAAGRLDWTGVGLVCAGLFCLTLALIQGNSWGWFSAAILGLFAAAVLLLAGFSYWELHIQDPLFDLRLFRDRTFAAASVAIMTVDVALMGTAFMLVIFMVGMMDYSELKAGLAITALPVAGLIIAPFSGRLVDRFGPRPLAVGGAVLSAAGLFALGHLSRTAPLDQVLWRAALVGAGIGFSVPALTASGMTAVPAAARGVGAGMLNTARQIGFVLGVAVLVAVFAHTMTAAVNRAADQGQALTRVQTAVSPNVKTQIIKSLDVARTIDATAGMTEIRKIAHPLAALIAPHVGLLEGFALFQLKNQLEAFFWDQVSAAFMWPFYVAGIAALIAVVPGLLLPRRLRREV